MTNMLILGAGFGGINAALDLEKKLKNNKDFKITLIDRNNFHLFTPTLYEVATVYGLIQDRFAGYLRGSVAIPYAEILEGKKIDLVQAEVKEIDLKEKFVSTNGGSRFDFDYLVIALGGQTEFYGILGVREYAFNFKTIDDAVGIFQKISAFAKASADKQEKNPTMKVGIIGGGFTGVELAAELGCCVKNIVRACNLDNKCAHIQLFEAGPSILPMINEKPRKAIEKRLKKLGIDVQTGDRVEEVGPDYIKIKNRGELTGFDLIIWAGGVRGPELLESSGLKLTKKGTVEVNEFLQTLNKDNTRNEKVFAIGDCVAFTDPKTGRPVPATAYVAHALADVAAMNILKHINKEICEPYRPFYDIWAAPVGGKWAYTHFKNINIKGFWGYTARQFIDLRYFLRILPLRKALGLFFKDLVIFTKND